MENKIDNYKFFGKFTEVKTSEFHDDNFINILISTKVYIKEEDQLDTVVSIKQDFHSYKQDFYFNGKDYKLNPLIIDEIYNYYLMQIKIQDITSNVYFRNSIETRIDGIKSDYSKLKLLIKNRNKLINKSIKYVYKLDGLDSLFDVNFQEKALLKKPFYNSLSNEEIENFLTLRIIEFDGEFLTKWKKYNLQNIQINCYNEIIDKTELFISGELNSKIESIPLTKIIFNDDGEKIFTFIVMKYPKKKNPAFFSYLYFYLKDKLNKLLVFGTTDNIDYRNYVIKLFNISFIRIINSNANNKLKELDTYKLFDKYVEEYYSEKNEYNLNKNE